MKFKLEELYCPLDSMYSSCLSGLSFILGKLTQSKSVLSLAASLIPGVVYFADTDKPIVALTIDDGPDSKTTPKILKILQKYGVQATFFVISNRIKGNELIIRDILNQGHELGNH